MTSLLSMDIRTLILAAAALALVQAGAMYFILLTRKTYPGFRSWTLAYLVYGTALLLLALRQAVPDFFSIVAANVICSGTPLLLLYGSWRFFGVTGRLGPCLAVLALQALGLAYYTYVQPDLSARIILIGLVMGGFSLWAAWELWRLPGPDLRQASRFTAVSMAAYGALMLFRGLVTMTHQPIQEPFQAHPLQSLFFLAVVLVGLAAGGELLRQACRGALHPWHLP